MNQYLRIIAAALLLFATTSTVFADPPALQRIDAKRLLELMEWRDVHIVTIQQGINERGTVAPIFATVIALATRDNRNQTITQTLHYDMEFGWFYYEMGEKSARLWTKDGYREIKPFTSTLMTHKVPNS
jgi:hypothetical protein